MTRQEAAIISAFTGILIGKFDDLHKYIENLMKHPVVTHELSKQDFLSIKISDGAES